MMAAETQKAPGVFGTLARKWMLGIALAGFSFAAGQASAATRHSASHESHGPSARHVVHHQLVRRRSERHVATRSHHELAPSHATAREHGHVAMRERDLRDVDFRYHDHRLGYATRSLRHVRYAARFQHSRLQCVPYAREISHIDLTGNAFLWWAEAAGRYARGEMPAEGAVLNFRAIGRMPLGHVAVVTDVVNSRTILVTQANWVAGTITNDVTVQDVSPENNWSEVEVELGDSKTWGAPYPTYGFIYNRPATDTLIATSGRSNEVAEAPVVHPVASEAPDRNLQ